MAKQRNGSAKKNLPYHNALILQKSKNLTVKDQLRLFKGVITGVQFAPIDIFSFLLNNLRPLGAA